MKYLQNRLTGNNPQSPFTKGSSGSASISKSKSAEFPLQLCLSHEHRSRETSRILHRGNERLEIFR